jgi:hypothetical protein
MKGLGRHAGDAGRIEGEVSARARHISVRDVERRCGRTSNRGSSLHRMRKRIGTELGPPTKFVTVGVGIPASSSDSAGATAPGRRWRAASARDAYPDTPSRSLTPTECSRPWRAPCPAPWRTPCPSRSALSSVVGRHRGTPGEGTPGPRRSSPLRASTGYLHEGDQRARKRGNTAAARICLSLLVILAPHSCQAQ